MKRIALFLLITLIAVSSVEAQRVKRTKRTEEDGFKWYLLEQGKYKGAEIEKGKVVIPLTYGYKYISYVGNGFLETSKANGEGYDIFNINGKQIIKGLQNISIHCYDKFLIVRGPTKSSVYDTNGRLIIPEDRKYTEIYYHKDMFYVHSGAHEGVCKLDGTEIISPEKGYDNIVYYGNYYEVKKDGKTGACDIYGKEIIAPKVTSPDPDHPLDTSDTYIQENYQEETAYNNSTSTYQPANNYNTYTPPAQHKQQSSGTKSKTSSTTQPKSTSSSSSSSSTSTNKSSSSTHKPSPHKNNASSFQSGPVKCANCSGTGMARCWSCSGKGTIRKSGIDKNGKQVFRNERCTGCGGSGKRKCTVCNGKGVR